MDHVESIEVQFGCRKRHVIRQRVLSRGVLEIDVGLRVGVECTRADIDGQLRGCLGGYGVEGVLAMISLVQCKGRAKWNAEKKRRRSAKNEPIKHTLLRVGSRNAVSRTGGRNLRSCCQASQNGCNDDREPDRSRCMSQHCCTSKPPWI